MKFYEGECLTAEQQKKLFNNSISISKYKKIFDNKILVDTAGFVPLEVRIKQMLLSGEMAKINASMYDSDDWRYMYDNVNQNALELGDDVEDVSEKLSLVLKRRNEILASKGLLPETTAPAPSDKDEGRETTESAKSSESNEASKDS